MVKSSASKTGGGGSGSGGSMTMTVTRTKDTGISKKPRPSTEAKAPPPKLAASKRAPPSKASKSKDIGGIATAERHQSWRARAKRAIMNLSRANVHDITPRAPLHRFIKEIDRDLVRNLKNPPKLTIASDVVPYVIDIVDNYTSLFLRPAADLTRDIRKTVTTKAEDVAYGLSITKRTCGPQWTDHTGTALGLMA